MAEMPRGTVTFLFTDVEDSSSLWERDGAAMMSALARHVSLLRDAVDAHGGVLFKTVGDGTQSAFPTAPAAINAAVTAQRALLAEPWPEELGPLRACMAIHAGEAEPRGGDYLAAPLNRLSRLLGMARGGQILLTEAVEQLAQDGLPTGGKSAGARRDAAARHQARRTRLRARPSGPATGYRPPGSFRSANPEFPTFADPIPGP